MTLYFVRPLVRRLVLSLILAVIPGLFRPGILFGYREENFAGFVPGILCNACGLSFGKTRLVHVCLW